MTNDPPDQLERFKQEQERFELAKAQWLEAHQRVLDAVNELPEPYKSRMLQAIAEGEREGREDIERMRREIEERHQRGES